ncbi:hypothetical protein [Aquimixticola soesokkakensis]|uniref:hypothetical protein n=1 Tax=Aquimixticola soesokkakensis TaxID=1519096 RepID=UPI0011787FE5|nr:hypothetical protein [Aquimixticola soesokkakensis]
MPDLAQATAFFAQAFGARVMGAQSVTSPVLDLPLGQSERVELRECSAGTRAGSAFSTQLVVSNLFAVVDRFRAAGGYLYHGPMREADHHDRPVWVGRFPWGGLVEFVSRS